MLLAATAAPAGVETHDDMVARDNLGDRDADGLHNACAFMPENDRLRDWISLIAHGDVGMADTGCYETNQDLVRPWIFKLQRLNR